MRRGHGDGWAAAGSAARAILAELQWFDGELISPWVAAEAGVEQVACGEETTGEIRRQLPDGWTTDTDENGIVLRRVSDHG